MEQNKNKQESEEEGDFLVGEDGQPIVFETGEKIGLEKEPGDKSEDPNKPAA